MTRSNSLYPVGGRLAGWLAAALLVISTPLRAEIIEGWLDVAVDVEDQNGAWAIIDQQALPQPPLMVLKSEPQRLLVNLRGVGLRWVSRGSVRLAEESVLQLACQQGVKGRADDYRNYGMRGEQADLTLRCVVPSITE